MAAVVCPLCGIRRARRSCPAVGQQICAVCCGTKRLTQIACPSDCSWLLSAREHPAAAVVRQQQRDVALGLQMIRDFDERQSHLFLLITSFLIAYHAPELQPLVDADVVEAAAALASTYETAVRGLIYEHRPASLPAERLVSALRPILAKAGEGGGSAFERDIAVVLRRTEEAVRDVRVTDPENRRAFIDFLHRVVVRKPGAEGTPPAGTTDADAESRLIIP
jgi:hypothetical protein